MILEEFDSCKDAIINPDMMVRRVKNFPEITIACFSRYLFESILTYFEPKLIVNIYVASGKSSVYEVEYKGKRFAIFQAFVGEPACVSMYEDLIAIGSKRLILLGNCGVLDKSIKDCQIIIPTKAIRDEGTSYHYAEASDTININKKYKEDFIKVLNEAGYPYIEGTTWTIDAWYRETREKMNRRKKQGAIVVEMECAGMQALCNYRNTDFFQYMYAGDNLDNDEWDPRSVSGKTRLEDKCRIMFLAFELGLRIMEQYSIQSDKGFKYE